MDRKSPARAASFLFLLFLLGLVVTVLVFVDLQWTHLWVVKEPAADRASALAKPNIEPPQLQRLRQSILNVSADCGSAESTGTGFVVKSGYVATAAHVLGDRQTCSGPIRLTDHKGIVHLAELEAVSPTDDLALLTIRDTSLAPLQLADTSAYESTNDLVRLVTIGYPLPNAQASRPDRASPSGEGSLSSYIRDKNVFVTSGLNLNPGNSGGPIFVRDSWKVLGIARAKLPNTVGEGIGYVASIRAFESFFREKTGQELR
jgi:S1-C subfamily serine protease